MNITPLTLTGLLRAALALLCSATFARSAISFTDIRLWAGAAPGAGIHEAALVVDFHDGQPGLVWGYRWPAQETRSGQDMLAAIIGADRSLTVDNTFFPNTISYGARTRSFSNNGTETFTDDTYWGYWVNNDVYYHPTNYLLNSHIVPPATEVVPLGNPYGPGRWVESSTGAAGRPLVNGSWDAWSYGVFLTQAGEPVAAIPEPCAAVLLAAGMMLLAGRRRMAIAAAGCLTSAAVAAGPYPPGPTETGSDAIPAASAAITAWASGVSSLLPGPRQAGTASSAVSYGSAGSVTGPPDAAGAVYPPVSSNPVPAAPVLSLGDGGSVTLTFPQPVADGEGADFAVFENGFALTATSVFAELAFVEVSSNGTDFVRFPAVSCTPTTTQTGTFGTLNPRNLHNLAGKYPAGYGTPFDLSELAGSPGLNIGRVSHIRLIDVGGDVNTGLGSQDSTGNWINDPFPTSFQTSGFDLDAVGVIHKAAEALPELSLTATINSVVMQFPRNASWTDTVVTLQQSTDGQHWSPLAVCEPGMITESSAGADVSESGSDPILVTVTAPRTAGRQIYRLKGTRAE